MAFVFITDGPLKHFLCYTSSSPFSLLLLNNSSMHISTTAAAIIAHHKNKANLNTVIPKNIQFFQFIQVQRLPFVKPYQPILSKLLCPTTMSRKARRGSPFTCMLPMIFPIIWLPMPSLPGLRLNLMGILGTLCSLLSFFICYLVPILETNGSTMRTRSLSLTSLPPKCFWE